MVVTDSLVTVSTLSCNPEDEPASLARNYTCYRGYMLTKNFRSIGQIIFDLTGGILSLSQLIIDASMQNDWSGVTGNPTKLGLAVVSMSFDLIFITQHFVLYKDSSRPGSDKLMRDSDSAQEPLLGH